MFFHVNIYQKDGVEKNTAAGESFTSYRNKFSKEVRLFFLGISIMPMYFIKLKFQVF